MRRPHRPSPRRGGAVVTTGLALVLMLGHVPAAADTSAPAPAPTRSTGVAVPPLRASSLGFADHLSIAVVEESTGQVLVTQAADDRRPVASAIKLLTALVVVDALPAGSLVTVGQEVLGVEGSSYGLRPGESRSVEDLLTGLLLRSGNDVAAALAVAVAGSEEAFVRRMGERLALLGIDARPGSASGLEESDALSAHELASVAVAALDEPRIRALVGRSTIVLPGGTEVENRNGFLLDDPTATGLKTGFTSAAGYTLAASAEREGRGLVAVVLGARDDRERREVVGRLLDHSYAATTTVRPVSTVGLRTGAGPVELHADLGPVTLPTGGALRFVWPTDLRPSGSDPEVRVLLDGTGIGAVAAARLDGRSGAAETRGLGSAIVEGVYAALRPSALRTANEVSSSG